MAAYLRAGALHDWTDTNPDPVSLAKEIENAVATFIKFPPDDKPEPRRELFVAIAEAIVNHLSTNAQAFVVTETNPLTAQFTVSITVHRG